MKSKQKGFIETTLIVMVLAFAGVVGTDIANKGNAAPVAAAPVYHNYNGGFTR